MDTPYGPGRYAIQVPDMQSAQAVVQAYNGNVPPNTFFILPDGSASVYSNGKFVATHPSMQGGPRQTQAPPTGQQTPPPTTPTQPQAAPDRNTNNPINLGQQYYANLNRLYEAQAKFQEAALQQFIEEAAAGNPALKAMLGNLQYSMNEDQLPLPERQALNAQREKNRQQALTEAGLDDHAQVQLRHQVNNAWNTAFDQQQAAGTSPGGSSLVGRGYMETANIPLRLQQFQEQRVDQARIARNAEAARIEKGQENMRVQTPFANAQGRVTDLNNIGPNGQRTNTYKQ